MIGSQVYNSPRETITFKLPKTAWQARQVVAAISDLHPALKLHIETRADPAHSDEGSLANE